MVNIYGLVNPKNNRVFYVGATLKPLDVRLSSHLYSLKRHTYNGFAMKRKELLLTLQSEGLTFKIKLLECVPFKLSNECEKKWFDYYNNNRVPLMQKVTGNFRAQLSRKK